MKTGTNASRQSGRRRTQCASWRYTCSREARSRRRARRGRHTLLLQLSPSASNPSLRPRSRSCRSARNSSEAWRSRRPSSHAWACSPQRLQQVALLYHHTASMPASGGHQAWSRWCASQGAAGRVPAVLAGIGASTGAHRRWSTQMHHERWPLIFCYEFCFFCATLLYLATQSASAASCSSCHLATLPDWRSQCTLIPAAVQTPLLQHITGGVIALVRQPTRAWHAAMSDFYSQFLSRIGLFKARAHRLL